MKSFPAETWIDRSRQVLDLAQEYVFKETQEGLELKAFVFTPDPGESEETDTAKVETGLRPAAVFLANSFWDNHTITQYAPQCLHLVERGAVAVLLEYRMRSVHGTGPVEAMSDARSGIRWIRYNAEALRVDPSKIIGAGGSGGAQMMLAAALIPGVADDPNDPNLSCVPDALVLYSPIVDTSRTDSGASRFRDLEEANRCNPSRYIGKHTPPTLIFQGTEDRVVPFEAVVKFVKAMKKRQNVCELCLFEGRDHSFYNFNVNPEGYDVTTGELDRFLVSQGFLPEMPAGSLEGGF